MTGLFLIWLPKIFVWSIFIFTSASYVLKRLKPERSSVWGSPVPSSALVLGRPRLPHLIVLTILFYVFYASLLTVLQYYTWSQNDFTKILLTSPLDREALQPILGNFFWLFDHKLGYFLLYVVGRFWLEVFLSVLAASILYLFFQALALLKKEFFKPGEKELAFLGGLLVGWPNFVIFLPLAFSLMVVLSMVRRVYFKEYTTTMHVPFLIATFLTLLFGDWFISLLHFTVLRI